MSKIRWAVSKVAVNAVMSFVAVDIGTIAPFAIAVSDSVKLRVETTGIGPPDGQSVRKKFPGTAVCGSTVALREMAVAEVGTPQFPRIMKLRGVPFPTIAGSPFGAARRGQNAVTTPGAHRVSTTLQGVSG
jgi:hypothetical protein